MPPKRHPTPSSTPRWAVPKTVSAVSSKRPVLSDEDVATLGAKMRAQYRWDSDPRPFQLEGIKAQVEGVDMIIQAPTGSGKTAIAAGPHLWPTSTGKITIMVCPLLALEDEMVCLSAPTPSKANR